MSKEDIIAMAREANPEHDLTAMLPFLSRFAALVAAKEREAIAAHYDAQPHVEFFGRELADYIRNKKAIKSTATRSRLEGKP